MQTKEEIAVRRRRRYVQNKDEHRAYNRNRYHSKVKQNRVTDPTGAMWANARDKARECSLPFNLEKSDIVIPSVCPIFGTPFDMISKRRQPTSPTLDRTVPEKGYVKGNIAVISYKANRLKSNATPDELEMIAKYLRTLAGQQ